MFSKIIGQDRLISQLVSDYTHNQLPQAILLSGNNFSGKLTIALELARILTCKASASDDCTCASCVAQAELLHPNTFLLGNRYFAKEIEATARTMQAYVHHGKALPTSVVQLMLYNCRKLIRRFDSALWESDDNRYKEARSVVQSNHEELIELLHDEAISVEKIVALETKFKEMASILHNYSINIGQMRSLLQHCNTLAGEVRVVIMEEAHLLQESARNALLKTLEEPPAGLYFILLSNQKEAIIPTILSRVRSYQVLRRTVQIEEQIIKRVFRNDQVQSFDALFSSVSQVQLQQLAERFLASALADQYLYYAFNEGELALLYGQLTLFLRMLYQQLTNHDYDAWQKRNLAKAIQATYQGYSEYNQNPEIAIYSLHQQIAAIIKNS